MDYYPAIKRNEVLAHATTQMNLKTSHYVKKASHKGHILCDPVL